MRWVRAGLLVAAIVVTPAPAAAAPYAGYDGSNPFICTIQDVGFGTDYPDPDADPFCVRFDKTRQNVTELGIVDFLSQEPARVAAASPKCFYYQTDRWRGSIVQDDASTETYGYDGFYWFDKARGAGGVAVKNFRVAGQQSDPTMVPGFPAEYRPYFGPGRGGFQYFGNGIEMEPRCVEFARRKRVYASGTAASRCRLAGGRIGRGIGGVRLRQRRSAVRAALGAPTSESLVAMRYCLEDGATLSVGFLGNGPRRRVIIVKVDHPAYSAGGLAVGVSSRRARRVMRRERVRRRRDGSRLLVSRGKRRTLIAMVRRGRVRYVAVARPRASLSALAKDLRRVR